MTTFNLKEIAKEIRDIDFGMLSTVNGDGQVSARPMSNNRNVEYDGDNYFFTFENTEKISDIRHNNKVGVTFTGSTMASIANVLGKPPLYISIEGTAELIEDKQEFSKYWDDEMKRWFKDGIDTAGLILIKVNARKIHYWDGTNGGEFDV